MRVNEGGGGGGLEDGRVDEMEERTVEVVARLEYVYPKGGRRRALYRRKGMVWHGMAWYGMYD